MLTHRICPPGSSSHKLQREINITNLSKRIPLHFAAQSGYIQCINILVENKSDLSIGDERANTPLHLAAMSGSADSVKYLIENGADLILDNKHTALHMVPNSLPNVEDIMTEILNESIEVTNLNNWQDEYEVSMKVLRPKTRKRMTVANGSY